MFYLVYKITNTVNGKFYVGCHKTTNKEDGYMGSGVYLRNAIQKYGLENFAKEILVECSTESEMYDKERELVVLCEQSYNLKEGGNGGFDHINSNEDLRIVKNKRAAKTTMERYPHLLKEWGSKGGRKNIEMYGVNENFIKAGRTSFLGKQHTDENKRKIGDANAKHQSGVGNSQFGTMWITDGTDSKKISKNESIPEGWRRGRVMKQAA